MPQNFYEFQEVRDNKNARPRGIRSLGTISFRTFAGAGHFEEYVRENLPAHVAPARVPSASLSAESDFLDRGWAFLRRPLSIGALGGEALEVHVVPVHVVLQQLREIPAQDLELRPPVGIGVPASRYYPEELASTVRRPLQPITVVHVPHDFPRRHIRVRC